MPDDASRPQINGERDTQRSSTGRQAQPVCPVCGGPLVEIKQKLQCTHCRSIVETCCEGGRG